MPKPQGKDPCAPTSGDTYLPDSYRSIRESEH
jgi:hypothetical protein